MTQLVDAFVPWLADLYLAATGLLVLGSVTVACLRQPARRMAVAWGTMIGLALVVALVSIPIWPRWSLGLRSPGSNMGVPSIDTMASSTATLDLSTGAPEIPASIPTTTATAQLRAQSSGAETDHLTLPLVLATAFACGFALITLRLAFGLYQARKLWRIAAPVPKSIESELAQIAGRLDRPAHIRLSGEIAFPIATGAFFPRIVLPSEFAAPERVDELRLVLAHEWAHIRNGDLWLLAIDRCLVPLFWAHPLYWFLRRRIRDDQEFLADASACGIAGAPPYAEMLVRWARRTLQARPSIAAASVGLWERPSRVERRIKAVLDVDSPIQLQCPFRWRATMAILLATAGCFLASFSTEAGDDVSKADKPAATRSVSIDSQGEAAAGDSNGRADSSEKSLPKASAAQPVSGQQKLLSESERSLLGAWTHSAFLVHATLTFHENGTYRYEYWNDPKSAMTGKWRVEKLTEIVYSPLESNSKPGQETRWRIVSATENELKLQPPPELSNKTVTYTRALTAKEKQLRAELAGTWTGANGALGEHHSISLQKDGRFTWDFRDEPLRVQDTYEGSWLLKGNEVHLTFLGGKSKSGQAVKPPHKQSVFRVSSTKEGVRLTEATNTRLELLKVKGPMQ